MAIPVVCSKWTFDHLCDRGIRHCGPCHCVCGHIWDRGETVEPQSITLDFSSAGATLVDAFANWLTGEIERRRRDGGLG